MNIAYETFLLIFIIFLGDEFKCLLESIIEHTAVEREILSSQQELSFNNNKNFIDYRQTDK